MYILLWRRQYYGWHWFGKYRWHILFLLEYVKEYGYKKINIVFYGGEPLLNKKKIDILSEKLFKKYGNNYCFDIVTMVL